MTRLDSEKREIEVAGETLRHEAAMHDAEYRELDRRLLEEEEKATIRMTALRGMLVDARGDRLSVLAPCRGSIVRLAVKRQDAVVEEGEVLGEIACAGERLQVELLIPPSGIGKIKLGQDVKLRYEAFRYQRYGVRHAFVRWVSSVSLPGGSSPANAAAGPVLATNAGGGPAFRALADLQEQTISVDGQSRPLRAGMGGRADIVVGRRSLASVAFEPLRQLSEDLSGGARQ